MGFNPLNIFSSQNFGDKFYRNRRQNISNNFSVAGTMSPFVRGGLFVFIFISVPLFFFCLEIYFSVGESYEYSGFVSNYILVGLYCILIPIFIASTCLMLIRPIYTLFCLLYMLLVAGISFLIAPTIMERVFDMWIDFLHYAADLPSDTR
ncbi:hypothetical protein L21SP3_00749 [Sedimentisphaera cyanobacteriorum]|uniref:Uncharacterized protein n=2 Tax=Sedimentisphaera cyanobacteriorum TaxID=1940790 RepID=A0A1Q2HNZ4_9BACT|nr:hypothetical protein L21SP3_00749 [Sedimentisphaera cyanobacteriorum]